MIYIYRLEVVNKNIFEMINNLMTQLSAFKTTKISQENIESCLKNKNFYLLIVVDTEYPNPIKCGIVGIGSIFFQQNLTGWIGEIHDIVVDEKYRGRGIGKFIVENLLTEARNFAKNTNVEIKLYLTSRPERTVANALYLKLGFNIMASSTSETGTNLFKKLITP